MERSHKENINDLTWISDNEICIGYWINLREPNHFLITCKITFPSLINECLIFAFMTLGKDE